MLLEKIKQSSSQIEERNNYEALSYIRDQLKRLDEAVSRANKKVNKYVCMKKIIITYLEDNEDIQFKEVVRINKNISTITKNIKNSDFSDYGCISDIESVIGIYEGKLKDYWRSKYTLKVGNTLSILQLLEKLYILDDRRLKIIEVKNKISRIKSIWPFSESDIKIMDVGIEEANKMIAELHVSSNIQEFLKKASIGEATILDLNDEIISWLKDHGFAESVKLSFI